MLPEEIVKEYVESTQNLLSTFQKEASDYELKIKELESRTAINKEAAIAAASHLITQGFMSADNLGQKINDLATDPLGVVMKLEKSASDLSSVPSMGAGTKKRTSTSTDKMSKADRALFSKLNLL